MLVDDDEPDVDELHAAAGEVKRHLSPQSAAWARATSTRPWSAACVQISTARSAVEFAYQSRPRWATKGGGSAGYEAQLVSQD
jgi:hypothetical protein